MGLPVELGLGPNGAGLGSFWGRTGPVWGRPQLGRSPVTLWGPAGDPASFVVALAESLQGFSCPREWLERLREAERNKEQRNR